MYPSNLVTYLYFRSCRNRGRGRSAGMADICHVLLAGWGHQQYCQWRCLKIGAEFVRITWKLPFLSALLLRRGRDSSYHHKQGAAEGKAGDTAPALPCPWGVNEHGERESVKAAWWATADDYEANRKTQKNSLNFRWHLWANPTFPGQNQALFVEVRGCLSASEPDTSVTPTERKTWTHFCYPLHPSARQISDLSESFTCTVLPLVRKDAVTGIILQHHQH